MSATRTNDATPKTTGTTGTPRRVRNVFSGETMTFRRTSAETAGQIIELDLELRPLGAPGGLPHCHLPAERFELERGTVCVLIAGQTPRLARAGDVVEVPARRWHFILALEPTRARVTIRPGMRFDELLITSCAVASGDLRPGAILRLVPLLRQHVCI